MSTDFNVKNREKSDIKYNKDGVFDRFDITDLINNDLLIPKIQMEYFFYQKNIKNLQIRQITTKIQHYHHQKII